MYFEYNFMNIDAIMFIPDSNQITINRENIDLSSDTEISINLDIEVQSYYPAYYKPQDIGDRIEPRRTRWYNALIESRGKSGPVPRNDSNNKL
jgi:hypothetical protein